MRKFRRLSAVDARRWAKFHVGPLVALGLSGVLAATVMDSWTPAQAQEPAAPAAPAAAAPLERPDEAAARITARMTNQRVEITNYRTETDQTFADPDGTLTQESSARPTRVHRKDGSWTPVDTTLHVLADGSIAPAATTVGLKFSGGTGALATISDDGHSSAISWPGTLPTPTLAGDTATYAEVLPGVDLKLAADATGFSEVLVVKTAEAAANPKLAKLRFGLANTGVTTHVDADGNTTSTDSSGKPVFLGGAPRMWDTSVLRADGTLSMDPTAVPAPERPGPRQPGQSGHHTAMHAALVTGALEVTPDQDVLTGAGTDYPVYLDPGFTSAKVNFTMIASSTPTTSYWNSSAQASMGTFNGGANVWRSFFSMNTFGLAGKHITSAIFHPNLQYGPSCTASSFELWRTGGIGSGTTWNNPPSMASKLSTASAAAGFSGSCPATDLSMVITAGAQWAADNNASVLNLGLRAVSETDNSQWKKFGNNPTMSIVYNTLPGQPNGYTVGPCYAQCASPVLVNNTKPTFTSKAADPDAGQLLRMDYEIKLGGTVVQSGSSPWGTSGQYLSWTPTTALTAGTAYTAHVRAYDGTDYGPWSASATLTADTTLPSTTSITSSDYPAATWAGDTGVAGTFVLSSAGTTDLGGFAYGLDQPTPSSDVRASGTSATLSLTPTTEGPHTLYVATKDTAGNLSSAVTSYQFSVGPAAVTSPQPGAASAGTTILAVASPSSLTAATVQWRRGDADTWATIPTSDVTYASGGGAVTWPITPTGGIYPKLNWNTAGTVNAAEAGSDPLDGPLQIRSTFTGGSGGNSGTVIFSVDHNTGNGASQNAGPGSVNLLTGNLAIAASDASVSSYGADLSLSRTFNTRDAAKADPSGMFGAGWVSGVDTGGSGSDYTGITVTGSLVQAGFADGGSLGFAKTSTGSYLPEPGSENLTLTYTSGTDTYTLSDTSGLTTTFTKPTGSSTYVPAQVTTPGSNETTSYSFETVTVGGTTINRPTRTLAPVPAGVTCGTGIAGLVKGCRALSFTYAPSTTSIPGSGVLADYPDRLQKVSVTAWDPDLGTPAMHTIDVAAYSYDSNGRLGKEWDPRLDYTDGSGSHHLAGTYTYNSDGILATITPAAEEAWNLSYTTVPLDSGKGRLAAVSRSALSAGTATTTVVYNVPVSGTGAPYNLASTATSAWGQPEAPTAATALFPATQIPDGNQPGGTMPSNWDRATVTYMDANGDTVNTAAPGGGITTTGYDLYGNVIRGLTAANRQLALDSSTDPAVQAQTAGRLSSTSIYSADGQQLLETYGPEHLIGQPASTPVRARQHTVNTYDQGATGGPYNLVTTSVTGARVAGATTDTDTRTTTTAYDWTLAQPTAVTIDPAGTLGQTTHTAYNGDGLVTSVTIPAGGVTTNTPATTVTTYYTAAANATYPSCGGHAEWAGLTCRTGVGGQPATGSPLPDAYTTYDLYNQPRVATEVTPSGTTLRTTTTTYDGAGRAVTTQVTGASGTGTAVPTIRTVYEAATARATAMQSLDASNNVTAQTISTFDTLGRVTSYTDADSITSTTTYDLLSRPATTYDGKVTRTFTYDGGTERRGLPTSVLDGNTGEGGAGTFTGTYDLDGRLTTETMPNGIQAQTTYDQAGSRTALAYTQTSGCSTNCVLFADTNDDSIHGQAIAHGSTLSSQAYTYDQAGRLTDVADTADGQCTTRHYTPDTATNRTGLTSYPAAADGTCQNATGGAATGWTYDTANRVTTTGYTYDTLGRTTTVPAADTQSAADGNVTATYHVTDLVRSIAQGSRTTTYTLDVNANRIRSWTDVTSTSTTTRINHYDAEGDNPSWTDEGSSQYTRPFSGLGSDVSAIRQTDGTIQYQLANLHGDIAATTSSTVGTTGVLTTADTTEYGAPRDTSAVGARRYGWLGTYQRAADSSAGITLMGVRLYNPATGRFLQTDPIPGGSANSYDYANQDPINSYDLGGKCGLFGVPWHKCEPPKPPRKTGRRASFCGNAGCINYLIQPSGAVLWSIVLYGDSSGIYTKLAIYVDGVRRDGKDGYRKGIPHGYINPGLIRGDRPHTIRINAIFTGNWNGRQVTAYSVPNEFYLPRYVY